MYKREPVNRLLAKIWNYPLTVVEAPMGYGKTTAVKEYLKTLDARVLWLTQLEDSAISFWNGFSRLFRELDPRAAGRLAGIGVPNNSVFREEAVRIIEEIEFPAKTVIVLDDYHLLLSKDIDGFIELVVKSEFPNLHIVVLSRSVFAENTTELVLKGYCSVIAKSCFELSGDEIIEYCRLCGVELKTEDAAFLASYTEGWISAVYLCILGFLQDGRIERQASLHELIERSVYRHCSEEMQEFLANICIFDSFSLEQAEYVWPKGNAEALLKQLVSVNAFIKYDYGTRTYYLHNILTSYLRQIFARLALPKRQAVWKAAGKWHENNGDCMRAIDYYYQAADFDSLLSALEADKGNGVTNEHKEKLIRYFSECPAAIKENHPWASLIYAINLFAFYEMERFAKECEEIGTYIENSPGLDDKTRAKLAGELEVLCAFAKYNNIAGMMEHHQRACALLDGPAEFIDRNGSWTFGSPSVLYMFYRSSGQLEQEVQEMLAAMPYYTQLTAGHGSGAEYVMQAERYYYIGDFVNAEILAHKALYIAQSRGQVAIELCALFLQMRLAVVKGEPTFVLDTLRQKKEEIREQGLYLYIHTWDMCEGYFYSYINQANSLPDWLVKGDLQDCAIYFPSTAFVNIIRARTLLISGQYLKLIGLAEEFNAIASVFPNLLGQIYTYICEAAAKNKLGWQEEARETLRKALDIAMPDQMIMPFAENGDYIADLLTSLEMRGAYREFIGRIRAVVPLLTKNRQLLAVKMGTTGKNQVLTEREQAIAELVATGLSNRVIGETLYIAEVTVKKTLQNIFAKLGVNSRTAMTKLIVEQKRDN